jgi:hypothetical protein
MLRGLESGAAFQTSFFVYGSPIVWSVNNHVFQFSRFCRQGIRKSEKMIQIYVAINCPGNLPVDVSPENGMGWQKSFNAGLMGT